MPPGRRHRRSKRRLPPAALGLEIGSGQSRCPKPCTEHIRFGEVPGHVVAVESVLNLSDSVRRRHALRRHDDRSVRAFAVKPRACGAPQKAALGLEGRYFGFVLPDLQPSILSLDDGAGYAETVVDHFIFCLARRVLVYGTNAARPTSNETNEHCRSFRSFTHVNI
jgi:hypothetical protein